MKEEIRPNNLPSGMFSLREETRPKPLPFRYDATTELEKWRVETFWTKEPETIAWIREFEKGDVFFDVGANIGLYSLYAATKGVVVFSFEPMLSNFLSMSMNRRIAGFNNMRAFYAAISSRSGSDTFWAKSVEVGSTGGQLGSLLKSGEEKDYRWAFDLHTFTLDELAIRHRTPDHIKIDIDGGELGVVQGMTSLLTYRKFKSCLIEVDRDIDNGQIEKFFLYNGYKRHPLNEAVNHSRVRRAQEGLNIENIIFVRE